ncbi:uncharacterized protein LOC142179913 [Nicotiana tabacum]|uniref:Uncharacterized protein LOC142179913 n=1 Tax=Nicotiana tabacum TaxID=4097 RepID=A0AC58UBQ0_TOBAC
MEGESSKTYEDFEAEDLEVVESTDPDWLTIPKCRGNIGRLQQEYNKPKPALVKGELYASVESLPTFALEDDRPDWKCLVCLYSGEKGEELVEFPCREHHLHLECGKRLLKSDNKCPHCHKEMLTGNAAYDSWLIKKDEEE